jgi:3-(3-hydroxy-phenyl)propionate hydroxylase
MNQHPEDVVRHVTDDRVVIVGAGPAGCTAALLLADRGVPVTLLERNTGPHPLPRAVHLDDEVTRTLHRIGLAEAFLAQSRPGSGLRLLDARHRVMAEFRRHLEVGRHGFPQANMFHQPDLELLLFARVEAHPLIEFRRGVDVVGLNGAEDPFTAAPVRVRTRAVDTTGGAGPGGAGSAEGETFTGRLVLGCDGANSTVRDLVGVTMADLGFTERWLVVDLRTDRDLDTWDGVEQICDPSRAATFMQVTGDRYRWEFQLRDGEQEADLITPTALGALLAPWTGHTSLDGLEIIRSATYTFRARIASRFRVGRVFLLGDAAHLTPPFIGQGLAAGLRDADNLAWKVAEVLAGRATATLLDTYEAERRPHARALVKKAVLVGWAMTGGQDRAAFIRRVALALACRSTRVRDLIADPTTPRLRAGALQRVPGSGRALGRLRVGGLIGNPAVHTAAGSGPVRLDDVLRGRTAVLTARSPEPALAQACRRQGVVLVRITAGEPADGGEPAESAGAGEPAAGDPGWVEVHPAGAVADTGLDALVGNPDAAVLVRPDRVVAAVDLNRRPPAVPWSLRDAPVGVTA